MINLSIYKYVGTTFYLTQKEILLFQLSHNNTKATENNLLNT